MYLTRVAVLTLWVRASQPSSPLSAQFPWTLNSPPTLPSLPRLHKLSSPQSWPQWVHKVRGSEPLKQHSPSGRQALVWDQGRCDRRAPSSGCHPTSCGYSYSRGCRVHSRWGHVSVCLKMRFCTFLTRCSADKIRHRYDSSLKWHNYCSPICTSLSAPPTLLFFSISLSSRTGWLV